VKGDPFIAFIASRGFWSKAYISTLEEADEVTMAMPVKRSIKAIPVNILWFLFILTEMFSLFV
jgi:hypothetical protein